MSKQQTDPKARAWQRMLSGRRLDLLDPSPFDIEIEDIAHGLARVARWNGQTKGDNAFSVAEHCLLVEDFVGQLRPGISDKWRLAALLHDAPEYVVGDLISPFKAAVGFNYKALENKLSAAIHLRFGLPAQLSDDINLLIKSADRASAFFEATQLAGFKHAEATEFFGQPRNIRHVELVPKPTIEAQRLFLARFNELLPSTKATP
jgi:hypothetical protein